MNSGMLSALALISLITWADIARGQSLPAERAHDASAPETSGTAGATRSSWEAWIDHHEHSANRESHVPTSKPELGAPTTHASFSIETVPGTRHNSPSRLRVDRETLDQRTNRNGLETGHRDEQ